jgi:hypothetical protein
MLNLFQHLGPKIRFALKRKNPLVAVKTTLSVNGPPSPPRISVLRSDATRPGSSFLELDLETSSG